MKKIRIITSTSLFDGHDASINIMRRILQSSGAEVIHLGHNRSAKEIVQACIEEDAAAIAITSYQGGHLEFFKYIIDLLKENESEDVKVFGGGGGTILPDEIKILEAYGVSKIYSPDDGRKMGLQGMINHLLSIASKEEVEKDISIYKNFSKRISKIISKIDRDDYKSEIQIGEKNIVKGLSIGITGTGGAGKSTITDEMIRRFTIEFPKLKICILAVDPSKKKTGGALLGDRIRFNSLTSENIFFRSLSTKETNFSVNVNLLSMISYCKDYFDLVFVETAGIGQSDSQITELVDISLYAMTPEFGASTQLEKIEMLEYADIVIINKSDRFGAEDAKKSVAKQYQRNFKLFEKSLESMPVFLTIASNLYDFGMNQVFIHLLEILNLKSEENFQAPILDLNLNHKIEILPSHRESYLSEIVLAIRNYNSKMETESNLASKFYQLQSVVESFIFSDSTKQELMLKLEEIKSTIDSETFKLLSTWEKQIQNYKEDFFSYTVREKEIMIQNFSKSLSDLKIPKIATPEFSDWGDRVQWLMNENFPGEFPYTAGVFSFKRVEEDPTRMFAGEGNPERTNRRFHFITKSGKAKRLSTAFDSVTLYGEDPNSRMDIYGKIGNSGVSIATLDDMKKLYSGFDLSNPSTSVSMTINGPAPMILAFFMNAAIDQACEKFILSSNESNLYQEKIEKLKSSRIESFYSGTLPDGNNGLGLLLLGISGDEVLEKEIYEKIKLDTLKNIRGTVQADILKEDQAQNTCIFSIDFSLKLMGDVAEYFVWKEIRNFYSVSISGYHMAEAGANPITQLAFTLANGFTYIEYYLSRGLSIDDFAPNLSFFFSNGLDAEYSVIGRVARRIWAKTLKIKYKASARSQMLKYHIQTSGRSLHAQEIEFNDIRTTLQALTAIFDNCNSLHTNAFDEAITTPTEDSVRRAIAIQMIINKENGLAKNENSLQGSFIIRELTDLVEEAVCLEFEKISSRKGVLGAMETMYQRNKIQEESMHYESLKHSGELPIMGVNTFLSSKGSQTIIPSEVIRSTEEEKKLQIKNLENFQKRNESISKLKIEKLKLAVLKN
jgi:isobutyryl-CoA mutase